MPYWHDVAQSQLLACRDRAAMRFCPGSLGAGGLLMGIILRSILGLALVLVVTARPGAAQPSPEQTQQEVAAHLAAGDAPAALAAIDNSGFSDLDKLFLTGQVLQAQGRHADAIVLYSKILEVRPDLVAFRQALIRSLIATGQWSAAVSQVDVLLQAEERRAERARLNALRARLDARRPGGLTFGVNLTPSTNVNRATSNEEAPSLGGLEGTIDETRDSGVGLTVNVGGFRRLFQGNGRTLEASVNLSYTGFSESAYNRQAVTAGLTYTVPTPEARWQTRATIAEYFYRDPEDQVRQYTLGQARRWVTGSGRLWDISGRVLRTDYRDASRAGTDSYGVDFGVLTRKTFGQDRWLTTTAGLGRTWAEEDRFWFISPRVGLELGGRVGDSWILSAGPVLSLKNYDENFSGLIPVKRQDRTYGVRISAQNTNWRIRGAVPRLSCLAERTNSNIVFYDNLNVLECSVGLSRQF